MRDLQEDELRFIGKMMSNKSLQPTRDGASSSALRFTSFGPARLSSRSNASALVIRGWKAK